MSGSAQDFLSSLSSPASSSGSAPLPLARPPPPKRTNWASDFLSSVSSSSRAASPGLSPVASLTGLSAAPPGDSRQGSQQPLAPVSNKGSQQPPSSGRSSLGEPSPASAVSAVGRSAAAEVSRSPQAPSQPSSSARKEDAKAFFAASSPPATPAPQPPTQTSSPLPATRVRPPSDPTPDVQCTVPFRDAEACWELAYRSLQSGRQPGNERAPAGRTTVAYCLSIEGVEGGTFPPALVARLKREPTTSAPAVSHRLLLSFFDPVSRTFFGATWESPPRRIPDPLADAASAAAASPLPIQHTIDASFISQLDGGALLVVQTLFMLHTSLGGPSEEYAAGWTILRPFVTRAASGDVSDGSSAAIKALAPLYQGSPLALQRLSAGAAPESHLRSAGGELRYALRKQAALLQAAHLLSEHAFYSSCDPVPGLLPGQRDGSTGALDLSGLSAPRLQATVPLYASAAHLTLPDKLEPLLRKVLTLPAGGSPARLVGWRLLLGVHTCHARCGGSEPVELRLEAVAASKVLDPAASPPAGCSRLVSAGGASVELAGFSLTRRHAVVAELQAIYDAGKGALVHATACWGVALPYDGHRLRTGRLSLRMAFGGASPAPLSRSAPPGASLPLESCASAGQPVELDIELRAPGWREGEKDIMPDDAAEVRAAEDASNARLEQLLPPAAASAQATFLASPEAAAAPPADEDDYSGDGFEDEADVDTTESLPSVQARNPATTRGTSSSIAAGGAVRSPEEAAALLSKATAFWQNGLLHAAYAGWAHVTHLSRRQRKRVGVQLVVHSFQLLGATRGGPGALRLEIQWPLSSGTLRTPTFERSARPVALSWQENLELLAGSRPAAALKTAALAANDSSDGRIRLALVSLPEREGLRPSEIGAAELTLPAVLSSGADLSSEAVPLFSARGEEIGEAVISLVALEAMRTLTASTGRPAVPAVTAPANEAGAVEGAAVSRSKAEAHTAARVHSEGPARSIGELLSEVGPAAPHSTSQLTRAEKASLWDASQRIGAEEGHHVGQAVGDEEEVWPDDATHNVLLQFISYAPTVPAALPAESGGGESCRPPSSLLLSLRFYHFDQRTTPRALLTQAPLGGSGNDGPAAASAKDELGALLSDANAGGANAVQSTAMANEEDLVLMPADPALAREGPGLVERFLIQPPAEGRDDHADNEAHAARRANHFRAYLRQKSLYLDVWDGESLLQIGTARVPLAALLRRGSSKVGAASTCKEYLTCDIVETRLSSIDSSRSSDADALAPPLLKGRLKLVLARLTATTARGAAAGYGNPSERRVASSRAAAGNNKVRLRAIAASSAVACSGSSTAAEEAALYQKQLRRQRHREWLRTHGAALGHDTSARAIAAAFGGSGKQAGDVSGSPPTKETGRSLELTADREATLAKARLQMAMRGLRAAELARAAGREERLRSLLAAAACSVRAIYPSYGSVEFVELPFRNPYTSEHCFTVEWEDPLFQLSIVTDINEWRALKARAGLSTPAEERLVLQGSRLWLMPQELVYIPLKFQAWQHGLVRPEASDAAALATPRPLRDAAALPISRRTVHVSVRNVQREPVATLELQVRPQPYVLDQSFRFHQPERDFLKTTIRVQPSRWHASARLEPSSQPQLVGELEPAPETGTWPPPPPLPVAGLAPQSMWVRCSDPDVVCGVHQRPDAAAPLEVSLKYRCGASPAVGRFLVLVYADPYLHDLREIWEVTVHSLRRIDMHALVGQTSCATLLLPSHPKASHGLVQAFTSSPAELRVSPDVPFALSAGATAQELRLALRPTEPGRKQYVVHVVESRSHSLLASYLVAAVNRQPAVTKSFSLAVPAALGTNRKVSLANPYSYDMAFSLHTDAPQLLSFRMTTLPIPAGETRYIGLKFAPHAEGSPSAATLRVYVNNADDKNEECMEIEVLYTSTGAGGGEGGAPPV